MKVRCMFESTNENIIFEDHNQIGVTVLAPHILNLAYEYDVSIRDIDFVIFLESWVSFMDHVNSIQYNIEPLPQKSFFTKLPLLYKDLKSEHGFRHPIIFTDDYNSTGTGRLILAQKYFPHIKIDILHNYTSPIDSTRQLTFRQIIDKISQNKYYKNLNHDDLIVRFYIGKNHDIRYVEFDNIHDIQSRGYETSPFYELMTSSDELWKRQLETIKNWSINRTADYSKLLDALIFENLDLI